MTRHTQQRIRVPTPWGEWRRIAVDAGIARLIQLMHRCGFVTVMSCEDHVGSGDVWLVMPDFVAADLCDAFSEFAPDVAVRHDNHGVLIREREARMGIDINNRPPVFPEDHEVELWFARRDLTTVEDALTRLAEEVASIERETARGNGMARPGFLCPCAEAGCRDYTRATRCAVHALEHERRTTRDFTSAERSRMRQAVREWVARNGNQCRGWRRPAHNSSVDNPLTAVPVRPHDIGGLLAVLCTECNERRGDS